MCSDKVALHTNTILLHSIQNQCLLPLYFKFIAISFHTQRELSDNSHLGTTFGLILYFLWDATVDTIIYLLCLNAIRWFSKIVR